VGAAQKNGHCCIYMLFVTVTVTPTRRALPRGRPPRGRGRPARARARRPRRRECCRYATNTTDELFGDMDAGKKKRSSSSKRKSEDADLSSPVPRDRSRARKNVSIAEGVTYSEFIDENVYQPEERALELVGTGLQPC